MKNRIAYLDHLKAFAIFLVVWGHNMSAGGGCINEYISFHVVYTFHMPLFAILSGYFFSYKDSCIVFLKKKSMQLLWPLVSWSIIVFGIAPLIQNTYISLSGGEPVHLFATARNIFNNIIDWGWWFLRALYLCFILAFVSTKTSQKHPLLALIISVVLFVVLAWSGIIPNMDNKLKGFFFLYPFFCMGFALKRYDAWIWTKHRQLFFVSCIVFLVCMLFWNGESDRFYAMNTSLIEQTGYENIVGIKVAERSLLRFVIGMAGSLTCILSFRIISDRTNKSSVITSFMSKVGQSTLGIYVLHGFVLDFFGKNALLKESPIFSFLFCLFVSLIIVMVCYYLYQLSLKNKTLGLVLWGKN